MTSAFRLLERHGVRETLGVVEAIIVPADDATPALGSDRMRGKPRGNEPWGHVTISIRAVAVPVTESNSRRKPETNSELSDHKTPGARSARTSDTFLMSRLTGFTFVLIVACTPPDEPNATDTGEPSASTLVEGTLLGGTTGQGLNPPSFANLRVEDLGATRAVVRFETDIPTSCEAVFGSSTNDLSTVTTDPDMPDGELALEHAVPLEDLLPGHTYFWRGRVTNAEGEVYVSSVNEFTTAHAVEQGEGVNFALPSSGAKVTGVSSNFGNGANDSTWGIENALDGKMATEWATNGDGNDAWAEIDFGTLRTISDFVFRSRKMSDRTAIVTSVQLTTGETLGPIGPFLTPDPDATYSFPIDPPLSTQIIRIEVLATTGGNTGAKEIQFYGEP